MGSKMGHCSWQFQEIPLAKLTFRKFQGQNGGVTNMGLAKEHNLSHQITGSYQSGWSVKTDEPHSYKQAL